MMRYLKSWSSLSMAPLPKNARAIEALKTPAKRRSFTVKGCTGLRLVVFPSGRKVWYCVFSDAARTRRWIEIGDFSPEGWTLGKAADRASQLVAEKPAKPDLQAVSTFGELFDLWLSEYAEKKLRTWKDEKARYDNHLASLAKRTIESLERKDIREVRDNVLEKAGPIQSNRVVALFNRVMNWAVDEDRAKFNPAARLRKAGEETRRERTLTDDELKAIWCELGQELVIDPHTGGLNKADLQAARYVRLALKLLIVTGQRRGEVIGMRRSEIEGTWWTIPGERTKNGLPHRVPLTETALRIITEAESDSPFLFPSTKTDGAIRPDAVTKQLARTCKRLKIEGVGPHDIRRTIGTTLRKLGVSIEDRGHVFNHISGAKAKVTSWNYDAGEHDDEKLRALQRWERELIRLTGNIEAKIIRFHGIIG